MKNGKYPNTEDLQPLWRKAFKLYIKEHKRKPKQIEYILGS